MTRLLVSVRDVGEALAAAAGGADFIDLKEPRAGALGGLPLPTIRAIVAALRAAGSRLPVSATIGDLPLAPLDAVLDRVQAVADCGVDIVKVGIPRNEHAVPALQALARCPCAIVPVFIADAGLDAEALALACGLPFAGVMLDTHDKLAGSLFSRMDEPALAGFVAQVRRAGRLAGLAGALRQADVPRVLALAPDFAGFRSAVCAGHRGGVLDPARLQALRASFEVPAPAQA
jgi:(5-formylfuran-3-yl)methyl phosphate synthase